MILFGWFIYGLLASLVVLYLYPLHAIGGIRFVVVLTVFLILGGIDYILSKTKGKKRSFHFH